MYIAVEKNSTVLPHSTASGRHHIDADTSNILSLFKLYKYFRYYDFAWDKDKLFAYILSSNNMQYIKFILRNNNFFLVFF